MMELDRLSDSLVLRVLAHLPGRQLLQLRAVNRRWRRLGLHPLLWRRRGLDPHGDRALCCAALRLAPCARYLDLSVPPEDPLWLVAAMTRCGAEQLDLTGQPHPCAVLLRRQAVLGRLKSLRLTLHHGDHTEDTQDQGNMNPSNRTPEVC